MAAHHTLPRVFHTTTPRSRLVRLVTFLLVFSLALTLLPSMPLAAAPPAQAALVPAEVLRPTLGVSPGGVWYYTAAAGLVLKNTVLPSNNIRWLRIAADPFDSRRWLLVGVNRDGLPNMVNQNSFLTMLDRVTPVLWYTVDSGANWAPVPLPIGTSGIGTTI